MPVARSPVFPPFLRQCQGTTLSTASAASSSVCSFVSSSFSLLKVRLGYALGLSSSETRVGGGETRKETVERERRADERVWHGRDQQGDNGQRSTFSLPASPHRLYCLLTFLGRRMIRRARGSGRRCPCETWESVLESKISSLLSGRRGWSFLPLFALSLLRIVLKTCLLSLHVRPGDRAHGALIASSIRRS